jgi:hypothetical protein
VLQKVWDDLLRTSAIQTESLDALITGVCGGKGSFDSAKAVGPTAFPGLKMTVK